MKKLRIYLDTSVIGGPFDDEFKKYSNRLINSIKENEIIGVISEITIREKMDIEHYKFFHQWRWLSMKANKKFDCVKIVREIRDNLYKQNKGKSLKEFTQNLINEAHKSELWKKVKIVTNVK